MSRQAVKVLDAKYEQHLADAWAAYGDTRRMVTLIEVSAKVSTNRVYRLQLDDGGSVIAKVSSYGSYFLFREDHDRIHRDRRHGHRPEQPAGPGHGPARERLDLLVPDAPTAADPIAGRRPFRVRRRSTAQAERRSTPDQRASSRTPVGTSSERPVLRAWNSAR